MKLIIDHGPILPHVSSLHSENGLLIISFFTPVAATVAHLATGWPFHDDRALSVTGNAETLTIHPANDPSTSATQHLSWTLADDTAPLTTH